MRLLRGWQTILQVLLRVVIKKAIWAFAVWRESEELPPKSIHEIWLLAGGRYREVHDLVKQLRGDESRRV